jgi:uncharacterized protein with FMN-binding domain
MALLLVAALAFTGCPSPTDSGDSGRTPVKDNVYTTEGIGKSVSVPITVSTTFVNNVLVDISIGPNGETGPILDSVKNLMIPRIIESQSIGVDSIAGATLSSSGVKQAIRAAITEGSGKPEEWENPPPKSSKKVTLTGYDVIVVGLGGAGMAAYVKASEQVNGKYPAVYGIEAGGKVGGNSATAGGPMAINSQYMMDTYSGGAEYVNRNALLKEWYIDMEADVSTYPDPGSSWTFPIPPEPAVKKAPYQGGPKPNMIEQLVDESGETVSWLAKDYNFHFTPPGGLGYPQYNIVANYGSEHWNPSTTGPYGPQTPGYTSDDGDDLFKTTMFTRAIETAKARNNKSAYKLELRANALIMSGGKVAGVKAAYRDGTTYEVYGKTIILATGGFISNPQMKQEHFGSNLRTEAVDTERGDGITMAIRDANAGTYNIKMPATVHIAQVKNIIQKKIPQAGANDLQWKADLTNLLLKGDSLVVGLKDGQAGDFKGKRFANEGSAMMGGIAFENWKAGGYFAAIYSNDVLAGIKADGVKANAMVMFLGQGQSTPAGTAITGLDNILSVGEENGNVVRGATLAELVQKLNSAADTTINAATLKATIDQYNGYVDLATAGSPTNDLFDKSAVAGWFGPPTNYYTTKIKSDDSVGYTAILGAGYYYGTCGGVDIDTDMQVLDTSKAKISGLYAVGQDSMGVLFNENKAYVGYGAAAQGWAITSGRIAGARAADASTK